MLQHKGIMSILILTGMALALPAHASTADQKIEQQSQSSNRTIAAEVNGLPIYEDQLDSQVKAGLDKYKRFNNNRQPAGLKQQIQAKVLDQYITAELFFQASQKQNIAEIEKKIDERLASEGIDKDSISRESIKRQIYIDEYLAKNDLSDPQIPEEEIRGYYEKFKDNLAAKKDTAHVQHIIIKKGNEESGATAQPKEVIAKARQLIEDGKPFAEIAKEYSQDANAQNGGNLGFIERGYMPLEFEKVAFSIEPGVVSEVIETELGFHILEVLERKSAGEVPRFDEVKDFLHKGFQEQLKVKNMTAHIELLKKQADIKIMLVNIDAQE